MSTSDQHCSISTKGVLRVTGGLIYEDGQEVRNAPVDCQAWDGRNWDHGLVEFPSFYENLKWHPILKTQG